MRKDNKYVKETRVGLVVFIALVIIMLALLFVGAGHKRFQKQAEYLIKFERLNGLDRGSQVRLNGVQIGSVSNLEIPDDLNDPKIIVTVAVDADVKKWIRQDSRAKIQTIGVLGDKYIEISLGSKEAKQLDEGSEIFSINPFNLDQLLSGSDEIINDVHQVSRRISSLLEKIDQGDGTLGKLINSSKVHSQLEELLTELKNTSAKLQENLSLASGSIAKAAGDAQLFFNRLKKEEGSLKKLIEDPTAYNNFSSFLSDGSDSFKAMKKSFDTLNNVLIKIDRGEGTFGQFINDPSLYREVENVIIGLGKVSMLKRAIQKARREGEKSRKKDRN